MMKQSETTREIVENSVASFPDHVAFRVTGGVEYTYRQMGDAIRGLHGVLAALKTDAGDRVALLSESQPAWPAAYLAVTSSAAVIVPILTEFTVDDVNGILEHSGARVLIISRRHRERCGEKLDTRQCTVLILEELFDDALKRGHEERTASASVGRETGLPVETRPSPESTVAIIYTSGTTGHSKGVELTHRNIVSNVFSSDVFAGIQPGESLLSLLPLAHTYECTLGMLLPFARGACVTYLDRPASPTVLVNALKEARPHLMLAVPLLIEKMVRARVMPKLNKPAVKVLRALPGVSRLIYKSAGRKLTAAFGGRLRFFGIGGAPLSADVEDFLYRSGFPYAIGYGLTETAPLLAGTSPHANTRRSTGTNCPGVELRIHDGEIQARGPNIMKGYYRDPEQTAEVFTEDGWFRTGDLGEFDARGRLYVKGRKKTVIIGSSGENIYPEAIESVINQFRGVVESLVIEQGGRLIARVILDYEQLAEQLREYADNTGAYLEQIRKDVNSRLTSFSRLTELREQKEPFEKTPTFKIKRYMYQ
jgi:long-chain acyl-CoA synthetase